MKNYPCHITLFVIDLPRGCD